MKKIEKFNQKQLKKIPELRPGYTVKVVSKIKEGDKERLQTFEGLIIAIKHGRGINATITVRRISYGVGVEKIFPVHSPSISSIEVVKKSKVRRAKLYYIRHKSAKASRLKNKAKKTVAEPSDNVSVAENVVPETQTETTLEQDSTLEPKA